VLALFLTAAPALAQTAQRADSPVKLARTEPSASGAAAPAAPAATAPARPPQQPAPRPGALAEETAHVARYDAAIKGVREATASPDDLKRLKAALTRISGGDGSSDPDAAAIADPAARKLVEWYRLHSGFGTVDEYKAFIAANPSWPVTGTLVQKMEEAIFTAGGSAAAIKANFKASPPRTPAGFAGLASAYLADGDTETARRYARIAWRDNNIASTLETGFIDRFGKLLTPADHKWRLDRLLLDDPRWSNDRNDRAAIIRRTIALLPEADRARANARLQVFLRSGSAKGAMDAAQAGAAGDWGFTYQRVQLLRRAEKIDEAAKLALTVPVANADQIVSPDGWWTERRVLAYAEMRLGNPRQAYALVHQAGRLGVEAGKDQAFLAGWIALRQLNDTKSALAHFDTFVKLADGPLSRSKAHYWLGRALEAGGRRAEAIEQYKRAAPFLDTFHGQLARRRLGGEATVMALKPPVAPSAEEVAAFNRLDAARATVIAHKAGLDRTIVRTLLVGLSRNMQSEASFAMVAHLAEALGDTQMAVRIGKTAIGRGYNLVTYAYPLHAFPAYSPLRKPPETGLLLAIARQESEFNTQTVSGAGARGILQVMPITAKHVCREHKIARCDLARLLTDAPYNTMMASAYIGARMEEFQNSYVLGIAGYNAGPGRARQWMREFGDPRDDAIDPIDWIYRIPFEETREYVQKVLSNLQIYRARLAPKPMPIALDDDLARARAAGKAREAHPPAKAATDVR
jgi:soluble lytic murein transglycosylase